MESSSDQGSTEPTTSSWTTQTDLRSSISFLSDSGRIMQHDALQDLKLLLDVLCNNGVSGPNLLRIRREFNLCTGEGGEGTIYEASPQFSQKLHRITGEPGIRMRPRVQKSVNLWTSCVIKQLRNDGDRSLAFQTSSAKTEINILARESSRQHPHIVTLQGWALCLDSLESFSTNVPRLPLLILEKALFDLKFFLNSNDYKSTSHKELCEICLGVGQGLEALHRDHISHGDLKPANVLLFDACINEIVPRSRWIAKLCDFGLANIHDEMADGLNKKGFKGTVGWKPPESFLDSPPISLQLCDIFAFGLVVWCVFTGTSSSPILAQGNQDVDSSIIKCGIGKQMYYEKATKTLRLLYDLDQIENSDSLAELTLSNPWRRIWRFFKGNGNDTAEIDSRTVVRLVESGVRLATLPSKDWLPLRTTRRNFLALPFKKRKVQMKRILYVLQESLNDDPELRHRQPWAFLDENKHAIDSFGSILGPQKYSLKQESYESKEASFNAIHACRHALLQLSQELARFMHQGSQWYSWIRGQIIRSTLAFVFTWLPSLLPQKPRQSAYNKIYSQLQSTLLPRGVALGALDLNMFDHGDQERCHDHSQIFSILLLAFRSNQTALSHPLMKRDIDALYTFARLRSRAKLCCWTQNLPTSITWYKTHVSSPEPLTVEIEPTLFEYVLASKDFEILAWYCRGEVGQKYLQKMQEDSDRLWGWLTSHAHEPLILTQWLTLLLEKGCDIAQTRVLNNFQGSVFRMNPSLLQMYQNLVKRGIIDAQCVKDAEDLDANLCLVLYLGAI